MAAIADSVDLETADSKSQRKYECVVCFGILLPPIYQCFNGHTICCKCEGQLMSCPVCRDMLPKERRIRNLILEEIVLGLNFQCQNKKKGCLVTMKYSEAEEHRWDCDFTDLPICSHLGIRYCEEKHNTKTILNHLKAKHDLIGQMNADLSTLLDGTRVSGSIYEINQSALRSKFKIPSTWSPHFFQLLGHTLFLTTKFDPKENCFQWRILLLGSTKAAANHELVARIKLMPKGEGINSLQWQGPVADFKSELKALEKETKAVQEGSSSSAKSKISKPLQFKMPLESVVELCEGKNPSGNDDKLSWRLQIRFARRTDGAFPWTEEVPAAVMDSQDSYESENSVEMAAKPSVTVTPATPGNERAVLTSSRRIPAMVLPIVENVDGGLPHRLERPWPPNYVWGASRSRLSRR